MSSASFITELTVALGFTRAGVVVWFRWVPSGTGTRELEVVIVAVNSRRMLISSDIRPNTA